MDDKPKDDAPASAPARQPELTATIKRAIGVGAGGGFAVTLLSALINPTGPSITLGAISGIVVGTYSGLSDAQVKKRRNMLLAEAEGRKAMIDAESDETLRQLATARANLASCLEERDGLKRRVDRLEERMDRMYGDTTHEIDEGLRHKGNPS